jgi:hypothetical protein
LLLTAAVSGQTFRGTILGSVTDATGAVVAGAQVTIRNANTGLERTTLTSADGSYSVPELPIGSYDVTVTQKGFQSAVVKGVAVDVATERRVDAVLKPGEVSQQVEVSGDSLPLVETSSAELGGVVTSKTIANLPVNGRDYTKLIYLNPGVAGSPDQISDSPGSYGTFSMNGSRGRANNFLLDGTDMNDGYRNDPAINEAGVFGDPATILPLDAVAELSVHSNYEAEFGRNSGAVINTVTKSGTNSLHGSAFEYLRTAKLGARNYFNPSTDPKNGFHNNQFGGSLGGPVIKDKTFFYGSYEGQRETGQQAGTTCVPDPGQIAFDEAQITAGGGTPNPVTTALLASHGWPTPNITTGVTPGQTGLDNGCPNGPNLSIATNFRNRVDSMIAKLDQNIKSDTLTGRYFFGDSDQSFPFAQLSGGLLPGFNTVTPTRVQLIAISYVKAVNASQVNEIRVGWNRFVEGFFPEDQSFNPASIGLDTGASKYEGGLPAIGVSGFSQIGATNSVPRNRVDSNWHFVDDYSWKKGKHDIKFGFEFRRTTIMQKFEPRFRGSLSFSDTITSAGVDQQDALTNFLLGTPSGGSQAMGNTVRHSFQNSDGVFVQDSYRATSRLTLNFGMRWDYFGVIGEKNHQFYRFDPTALGGGGDNVQTNQLYGKDFNNFAPRLAAAYDLTGKGQTVIRAGWGVFYDAFAQDIFLGHVPWNCVFCPGPAYPGIGPNAVQKGSAATTPLDANTPVYGGYAPFGDFFAADPKLRTPYTQNFNLNIQQELGRKASLQVGYVGARGTKLFRFRDINQPSQAQITANDIACQCTFSYSVPRPYANFFYLNSEESKASSSYHGLQASVHTNAWHGLTTTANFAWSHALDDASDSEDFIPNQAQPQDSTTPHANRGNSSFDIRRRFTWNYAYEFPHLGGGWGQLKNGWSVNGVVSLQDGQPFQLNYNFENDYSGAGEGFDRPDLVGAVHYGSDPGKFLDLTASAAPCTFGAAPGGSDTGCVPGTRHFGTLGRNSLRGPAFKEFNFSLMKSTSMGERAKFVVEADFFNILNHPNFSNPTLPNFIADVGSPDATGRHTGYYSLAATGDVGIGNPFLGSGGPRGVQFAAKVTF